MKVEEINRRVDVVKSFASINNYDMAHKEEDSLLLSFVVFCSKSKNLILKQKAEAILKVLETKYVRECSGRPYKGAVNPLIVNGVEIELKGNYMYSEAESELFKRYK